MPRPSDVTDADIKKWTEEYEQIKHSRKYIDCKARLEVYCAGCWLSQRIQESLELTELELSAQVEAHGQISLGRDPWSVAKIVLEEVLSGTVYRPGRELAEALFDGRLDARFGPGVTGRTSEGLEKLLQVAGVQSIGELLAKLGYRSVKEAREGLLKRLEETDARRDPKTGAIR
jgi:hypothetical protein